ncbi:MAG: YgdI/YgdR family lipoprotein [Pseudomonadota bacterium]
MKRLLVKSLGLLALLALAALPAGCSHYYRVTTYSGQIYTSEGQPKFDEDAKVYKFEQMDGKKVILNQKDVKEIKQED